MATSKTGLKTLWVPGKKKDTKGKIETTKNPVNYTRPQKKNEQWTLGGTKAMENLIKCEAQIEILNGVLPSTSKDDLDAINVLENDKINVTRDNDNQNVSDMNESDSICVCSQDQIDSKDKTSNIPSKTETENDRYEKLVTCLYYTLNLCECTIS